MIAFRILAVFMWATAITAAVVVTGHFAVGWAVRPPYLVAGGFEAVYGLAFGTLLWRMAL